MTEDGDSADAILRDLVEVWDQPSHTSFPPQDTDRDKMMELRAVVERAREHCKRVGAYQKAAQVRGS